MKFRYKNSDCDFNQEQLDEIREHTRKESKQKNRQKKRFSEDEFFNQQKQRRK